MVRVGIGVKLEVGVGVKVEPAVGEGVGATATTRVKAGAVGGGRRVGPQAGRNKISRARVNPVIHLIAP
jgi:hypothetical protein